ncbi:hypothetical protein MKZ38_005954 [Zalerion maritima]|uniref:Uncharacterized protein n=1 Tax=Zalerion maritima TaxID=339359 RepID=A0AAD5WW07_9PEZI|nr:hypothetical protein MKZ38_005954 [Zalerion maritima]
MNGLDKRRTGQHGTASGAAHSHSHAGPGVHVVRTVCTNPATPNITSSSMSRNPSGTSAAAGSASSPPQAAATVIAPPPKVVHASAGPNQPPDDEKSTNAASSTGSCGNSSSGNNNNNGGGGKDSISTQKDKNTTTAAAAIAAAAAAGTGAHRQDAQGLRARDERIASLEKELQVMENEFARELERASAAESETASFWQGKHSAVHTAYLRADTELRLLRAEVEVREAERGELREGWEMMRREAREREEVIRELRGQVRGLKEWVSKEARVDGGGGSVSDEVFAEGMGRLANGLQNWVIVHFRKSKIDLSRVDEDTLQEVSRLVPMYEEVTHTAKVHLLQSIVSSILVEEIFGNYFVGLSEAQAEQFRQMEKMLGAFVSSPEGLNTWRSQTLSMMRRGTEASPSSPAATPHLPPMTKPGDKGSSTQEQDHLKEFHSQSSHLVARTINKICHLLDSLTVSKTSSTATKKTPSSAATTSHTSTSSPPKKKSATNSTVSAPSHSSRETALRVLLNNSVALSRLLSSQKAHFEVSLPEILGHQKTYFSAETMEDISGVEDEYDDDADEGGYDYAGGGRRRRRREVLVSTFPMVVKMGDEHGGGTERYRNVILRARVLCAG